MFLRLNHGKMMQESWKIMEKSWNLIPEKRWEPWGVSMLQWENHIEMYNTCTPNCHILSSKGSTSNFLLSGIFKEGEIPKSQFQMWWNSWIQLQEPYNLVSEWNPKSQFHTWFLKCQFQMVEILNSQFSHSNPKISNWLSRVTLAGS